MLDVATNYHQKAIAPIAGRETRCEGCLDGSAQLGEQDEDPGAGDDIVGTVDLQAFSWHGSPPLTERVSGSILEPHDRSEEGTGYCQLRPRHTRSLGVRRADRDRRITTLSRRWRARSTWSRGPAACRLHFPL